MNDDNYYWDSPDYYHGQARGFEPVMRENEAIQDAHFWGKCSAGCKHDYLIKQYGHSWEAQPLELRALGRNGAKRVLKRMWVKNRAEMTNFLKQQSVEAEAHEAKRAAMTSEELADDDKRLKREEEEAREFLMGIIARSNDREQSVP